MPFTELDAAVKELTDYFQLFKLDDLVATNLAVFQSDLPPDQKALFSKDGVEDILIQLLINTQRGSWSSPKIMTEINLLNLQLGIAVRAPIRSIYEENFKDPFIDIDFTGIKGTLGDLAGSINSNPHNPSKVNPTVSFHMIQTSRISPSNKNANAISLFLNAIPTHEWSRSIPYLNIKFQLLRPAITTSGKVATPSLVKILNGSINLGDNINSADYLMQTARSKDDVFILSGDSNVKDIGESGIELFLMPQTLNDLNADNTNETRASSIIDRLRPFASINSFSVDVIPAAGLMAYRTAKLNFTLHDVSRLSEIADFIKAGLYNKTELLIEYGWEHPEKNTRNVFANFINGLKTKEKYQVSNYTINVKNNREAVVELDLYSKGAVDMFTSQVAQNANSSSKIKVIEELQNRISDLRKQIYKQDSRFISEIRGRQILDTASSLNSDLQLSKDLREQLKKTLVQLDKAGSQDALELSIQLRQLYGIDGFSGEVGQFNTIIAEYVDKKIQLCRQDGTDDPFIDGFIDLLNSTGGLTKSILLDKKRKDKAGNFISLGKLLLLFVIQPLAETAKFDDIQVLFYPLNKNAGFGRDLNLANFPIDINIFQTRYKKLAAQRRNPNISLREFLQFVSNVFLEDISSPIYGLRQYYRYEPDKATGEQHVVIQKDLQRNPTKLASIVEDQMRKAGIPDGVFYLPQVDVYVEAIPGAPEREGQTKTALESQTILRIHIFDARSSAYQSQSEFLAAQRDDSIRSLGRVLNNVNREAGNVSGANKDTLKQLVDEAKKLGHIQPLFSKPGESDQVYKFVASPEVVKSFVAKTMPHYIYGANNTSVLAAEAQTLQDAKLTTINMINSGDKGDLTPQGGATNGLPVRVFPFQINMRMFGCPIMEFTQNIFCDFNTNTSLDNVYAATKIQHSIEPGKFATTAFLTPLDAYGSYQSIVEAVGAALPILSDLGITVQGLG